MENLRLSTCRYVKKTGSPYDVVLTKKSDRTVPPIMDAHEIFAEFDTNKDGIISPEELVI